MSCNLGSIQKVGLPENYKNFRSEKKKKISKSILSKVIMMHLLAVAEIKTTCKLIKWIICFLPVLLPLGLIPRAYKACGSKVTEMLFF